ncbi:hypothetical protein PoMZ_06164 [Pyricularia oryzae]|uniref:L-asparaginase 1 n=1 Tax=Pyricularia oryzae TaxID=318829 RepID=A0A4P7NQ04_PYROR|nr:hypothetical protein PoMZ_06164 [Pyricularia oryzae]
MEYKQQTGLVTPRLIIHGGAGNITPENLPPERYNAFREALLTIVTKTHAYMTTPSSGTAAEKAKAQVLPGALDVAVHAVLQLEDNPLFNAGHGAVFTRDGINELEASIMVSRGHAKRAVGVAGLRRVRHPILLARKMLEHGDDDLSVNDSHGAAPNVPSAQGHTLLFGETAEALARDHYGLETVEPEYFFTQRRWDEHIRGLQRERESNGRASASWSAKEYVPQGTVGAVALDSNGVICVATSTGGLTNKLTGRIGDTPSPGSGFWAEEWVETGDPTGSQGLQKMLSQPGPAVQLSPSLQGLIADCLPTPLLRMPFPNDQRRSVTTTRSFAGSGTGNGDSFMRADALRTVAAMARFKPISSSHALSAVAGPGGELQRSAQERWGLKGEGEGGIIGIECAIVTDDSGRVVESRTEIVHDHNCGGMFRAWIDTNGEAHFKVFLNDAGMV